MKRLNGPMGLLATVLIAVGLAACGNDHNGQAGNALDQEENGMARLEGSVLYRERMMLRPGTQVQVQLEDVSKADAPATVIARVTLTPEGAPPYPFALEYDQGQIDRRGRYGLRATISSGDRLLFTSTEYIDAFAGPPVEIMVQRVPERVDAARSGLEGTRWVLQTLGGEQAGTGAGGNPVDIEFIAEGMRAAGFSGCNRYTGSYGREGVSQHGSPLQLGPMAATRMACAEGMELEQSYLQMLDTVDTFRLDGETLSLLAGPDVVATFVAQ